MNFHAKRDMRARLPLNIRRDAICRRVHTHVCINCRIVDADCVTERKYAGAITARRDVGEARARACARVCAQRRGITINSA